MKPTRPIFCAALAVVLGGFPLTSRVAGQVKEVPAVTGPATKTSADTREAALVQAIRQAQDPSAAIQAYHDASGVAPGNLAVERAYVARMVDFGLPEMADVQAQDVIRRDPEDGRAWAVAAYMSAKRDQNDLAIKDVAMAVRLTPGDPFVLRTAGQLAAWYDKADKASLPEDAQVSMGLIKTQMAGNPAYAEAYGRASDTYRELAAAPNATQPTETTPPASTYTYPAPDNAPNPDVSTYTYTPPPGSYTAAGGYYSSPSYYYPDPYVSSPYYQSWWPGPVWGGAFWWPTFSSVVIVDGNVSHCNPHKFNDCFHNGHRSFVGGRHGNDFAFARHDGNTAFATRGRGPNFNTGAFRGGTTIARADGNAGNRFAGSSGLRDGRVIIPSNRGGTISRAAIPGSTINRTWIAPARQMPSVGGYRQLAPSPGRIAPSGPVNIGRPGMTPSRPTFSAPRSMPSGGAHFGGGGHIAGGGGPIGGGGGGHFSGGGGGGHFGGGGGHGGR